jgi:hypothetical protein
MRMTRPPTAKERRPLRLLRANLAVGDAVILTENDSNDSKISILISKE